MIIDFTARARDYSTQRTFRPADNFYADRCADIGVKEAVVGAGIYNSVEALALGMIVDDLNGEDGPPDALLLWDAWIYIRK